MANFLDDYAPVEDRLRAFWSDHPDGRVMTTLIDHATATTSSSPRSGGLRGSSPRHRDWHMTRSEQLPPNMKARALEVCETSAIGRALANLGYAAKGKRPSREEMLKASPAVSDGT